MSATIDATHAGTNPGTTTVGPSTSARGTTSSAALLHARVEVAPIERIPGDVAVLGLCEEDCARPLRGPAARVDWRSCGLLADRIASGAFTGAEGDVLLVTSRGLAAKRLLVVGLGTRDGYGPRRCAAASALALTRARELAGGGATQVVFATPGVSADDFARHAAAVVEAGEQALAGAAEPLVLRIPVQPSEAERSERALLELEERGRVALISREADR